MSVSFRRPLPLRAVARVSSVRANAATLATVALPPVLALFCGPAAAESNAADAALPAVIVTATRTPTRIDQTLADVTVIDRAAIERAVGRTLPELLAQQPGLQFSSNGGLGKNSSIYIHGLEARHTLLLIDGARYVSASVGTPSFDNIPLDDIERIEIVRGPLSGLYGSDAVGGVIQIFTRRGREGLHGNGSATVGSKRYEQLGGGLSFGQGAFSGAVQVQHTENRGFSSTNARAPFGNYNPDTDGFRQDAGNAQFGLKLGAGWQANAHLLHSVGTTQYDDGLGVDSHARLTSEVLSADVGGPVVGSWRSQLRLSRATDGYDTLASVFGPSSLGLIGTVQRQLSWENSVATSLGTALVLAERLEQHVSRPGTPFTIADRAINAVALGLSGQRAGHTWQANVRRDHNSQFGNQTTGTLGYGYNLTSAWRASASIANSFVAPSFNQLYYPAFGNPNLQPEKGRHAEVSLRWAGAAQRVDATYFANRIRGFITPGANPGNIDARIDGLSLTYEARIASWTLTASAEHVDPRNDSVGKANYDKQLPRRAKNSVKAGADYALGAWQFGANVNAFSSRWDDPANTLPISGYGTLDVHAEWRMGPAWALGLRLNNLANKAYETVYGYNQPGREGYLTVRYSGP